MRPVERKSESLSSRTSIESIVMPVRKLPPMAPICIVPRMRPATFFSRYERTRSRPKLVCVTMTTTSAATSPVARRATALAITTRRRRDIPVIPVIPSERLADGEVEVQAAEEARFRHRSERAGTGARRLDRRRGRAAGIGLHGEPVPRTHTVEGRNAGSGIDGPLVIRGTGRFVIGIVPDIDPDCSDEREDADARARGPFELPEVQPFPAAVPDLTEVGECHQLHELRKEWTLHPVLEVAHDQRGATARDCARDLTLRCIGHVEAVEAGIPLDNELIHDVGRRTELALAEAPHGGRSSRVEPFLRRDERPRALEGNLPAEDRAEADPRREDAAAKRMVPRRVASQLVECEVGIRADEARGVASLKSGRPAPRRVERIVAPVSRDLGARYRETLEVLHLVPVPA